MMRSVEGNEIKSKKRKERKTEKKQITCAICVCCHQNWIFVDEEEKALHSIIFPGSELKVFNGLKFVCVCCSLFSYIFFYFEKSSFVEMFLVENPKRWCLKPLMPMNLNNIFSWKHPLEAWDRITTGMTGIFGYGRGFEPRNVMIGIKFYWQLILGQLKLALIVQVRTSGFSANKLLYH